MHRRTRGWLLLLTAVGAAALLVVRRRAQPASSGEVGEAGAAGRRLHDFWTRAGGYWIYARVGTGPGSDAMPVVLVHGYGLSGSYLVPIAVQLSQEVPVFVPDLPGHGRSERPRRALGIPELAEALRAWMDAVGLRRVALLGQSMGCQIVAELAAQSPDRVDRLILVGPTLDSEARTVLQQVTRLLRTAPAERLSLILLVVAEYLRQGPWRLLAELKAMLASSIEEDLVRIDAPALVVRGERDRVVPERWADEVARLLGEDGAHSIPDAGHAVQYSAPDELMRLIRPFLDRPGSA